MKSSKKSETKRLATNGARNIPQNIHVDVCITIGMTIQCIYLISSKPETHDATHFYIVHVAYGSVFPNVNAFQKQRSINRK